MGAVPAIQLGHCGRNAGSHGAMEDWRALDERDARVGTPPWRGLAPSPLPARRGFPVPIEMDLDDIRTVLHAFRDATHRATDAGYDIAEIHGAHGYLIHQFLSPVSNHRTDMYGGSRENRMRLALEVAETVRAAWPQDKPLFFRVSAVDGKGGLWGLDDTVALARELRLREVDVVDCSSGGISGNSDMALVPRVPGYQVPYASRVRREAGVMSMAVGLITDPQQAEAVLRDGHADLVAMARELMIHADWPLLAAKALQGGQYDLMAPSIAHRLRRRDEQAVAYPPGSAVEIPVAADRSEDRTAGRDTRFCDRPPEPCGTSGRRMNHLHRADLHAEAEPAPQGRPGSASFADRGTRGAVSPGGGQGARCSDRPLRQRIPSQQHQHQPHRRQRREHAQRIELYPPNLRGQHARRTTDRVHRDRRQRRQQRIVRGGELASNTGRTGR